MKRQSYVKIVPRRFTPDSEIISIGSNQYTTQWVDVKPEKVYQDRGGQEPTDLGAFSWDDVTKTLTFTTTSAPNENIFIDYPLRFCTSTVEYVKDNPVDDTGDVVRWEPRLDKHPDAPESASNMLNGVLSTSSTRFNIDNRDYALNKYLTKYDNFKNRAATFYGQLGDVYKKLAYGYISEYKSGPLSSFTIKTSTKLMDVDATLGNREAFHTYTKTKWPSLEDGFEGRPIPVQYGYLNQNPGKAEDIWYARTVSTGKLSSIPTFPEASMVNKCPQTTANTYLCGIVDQPWSRTSIEYISCTYVSPGVFSVSSQNIGYFIEGDNYWFSNSNGSIKQRVLIESIDYGLSRLHTDYDLNSNYIKIAMPTASFYFLQKGGESSGGSVEYNSTLIPVSWYSQRLPGQSPTPLSFSFELTDSGQYLVYLSIVDLSWPEVSRFYGQPAYCILRSKPISQSNLVKRYIESSGIEVDTASFSQAQADANTNVMMTVNAGGEMQSVKDVVENVVSSCNGILYIDSTVNKCRYKIVKSSLAGTDWVITSKDILEPDLVPIIDYQDTASRVRMVHPYADGVAYINGINSSRESSFSRAFNTESKTKTFKHYLTDSSDVIDYKSETHNTAMVMYKFSVMPDKFFDIDIGDVIEINDVDGRLLSFDDSVRLLVVARTRSVEKIGLTAYEFQKIP